MASGAAYEISSDRTRIDFERVHSWLSSSYWSPGVSRERVEQAARGSSLVLGAYLDGTQVAYLRVVSDRTTFAWICDVWVDDDHRGLGIAKAIVRSAMADPDHADLRRWVLATRNAHPVYAACGFQPLPKPESWMVIQKAPIEGSDSACS